MTGRNDQALLLPLEPILTHMRRERERKSIHLAGNSQFLLYCCYVLVVRTSIFNATAASHGSLWVAHQTSTSIVGALSSHFSFGIVPQSLLLLVVVVVVVLVVVAHHPCWYSDHPMSSSLSSPSSEQQAIAASKRLQELHQLLVQTQSPQPPQQSQRIDEMVQQLCDRDQFDPAMVVQGLVPALFVPSPQQEQEQEQAQPDTNGWTATSAWTVLEYLVTRQATVFGQPAVHAVERYLKQAVQQEEAQVVLMDDNNDCSTTTASTWTLVVVLPPPLLDTLVSTALTSAEVGLASPAHDALLHVCRGGPPTVWSAVLTQIVTLWQHALQPSSSSPTTTRAESSLVVPSSTTAVRCASWLVSFLLLEFPKPPPPQQQQDAPTNTTNTTTSTPMTVARQTGALQCFQDMVSLYFQDDPLVQLSVLDLLEQLAATTTTTTLDQPERLTWLTSPAILHPLLRWAGAGDVRLDTRNSPLPHMEEKDAQEPDPFLGGPAIRVLGAMCQLAAVTTPTRSSNHNDDNTHNDQTWNVLCRGLYQALSHLQHAGSNSTLELDRLVTVTVVSSLARASPHALQWILEQEPATSGQSVHKNTLTTCLADWWVSIPHQAAQSKLQAASLNSIAMVLEHNYYHDSNANNDPMDLDDDDNDPETTRTTTRRTTTRTSIAQLKKRLYALLGSGGESTSNTTLSTTTTTEWLVSLMRQGHLVPDVALGAYAVVTAFILQPQQQPQEGGLALVLQSNAFVSLVLGDGGPSNSSNTNSQLALAHHALLQAVYERASIGSTTATTDTTTTTTTPLLAPALLDQLQHRIQQGPYAATTTNRGDRPWYVMTEPQ